MEIKRFTSNLLRVTEGRDQAEEGKRTGQGPLRQKSSIVPKFHDVLSPNIFVLDSGDDICCGLYVL